MRRNRVVLATARVSTLDGNLLHIHRAMVDRHPELDYVLLLEPYSYGLAGKLAYLVRLVRGMYYLQTARLFVIDNAYLPVHVAPHRPTHDGRPGLARGRRPQALRPRHRDPARRAGTDLPSPLLRRGRRRRRVDACAVRGGPPDPDRAGPCAWLATDRLLLRRSGARLGPGAGARDPSGVAGRRVVLYAPTFRGRGVGKRAAPGMDAPQLAPPFPRTTPWSSRPTRISIRKRPRRPATTSSPTRPATSTTSWRWPTS